MRTGVGKAHAIALWGDWAEAQEPRSSLPRRTKLEGTKMTNLFSLDKWMYREGVMHLQIPYPHTAGDRVLMKRQNMGDTSFLGSKNGRCKVLEARLQ